MKNHSSNFYILIFVLSGIFIFILISVSSIQVSKGGEFAFKSSNLVINNKDEDPHRGLILDSSSKILAKNKEVFDIVIFNIAKISNQDAVNSLINNHPNTNVEGVIKVSNLNNVELRSFVDSLSEEDAKNYKIEIRQIRDYIFPLQFTHVIGYTGIASDNDLQNGYELGDSLGKYKLENQYDHELRGIKGKKLYIDGVEFDKQSEPGQNIYLNLNSDWQIGLYQIIQKYSEQYSAAGGAGVIVDNSNGDIIAQVSYPGFDTNSFVKGISSEAYKALESDRRKPLIDKAIGLGAAPGSTFKIISAYNLLEHNVIDRSSRFYSNRCMDLGGGYNFCEFGKFFYGDMNVERALYKSSNLFFCNYTLSDYRTSQMNNFIESAKLFNVGSKTGIDLQGEISGILDSPELKKTNTGDSWFDGDTCNAAIGQGAMLLTPLQMAMVVSAVENNGVYYKPHIIQKIESVEGNISYERKPEIIRTIPISEETKNLIQSGLHSVAKNPEGTVYPFLKNSPGNIRAKTGTAEVFENVNGNFVYRTHGWIVGAFDYNGRSYSFAYYLSYGAGGFYVAQIARDFMSCLYSDFQGCK